MAKLFSSSALRRVALPRVRKPRAVYGSGLLLLCVLASGCDRASGPESPAGDPIAASAGPPGHVGSEVCAECHAREAERWRGSHHDLAMQVATDETVLGNFDGAVFEHDGITTSFSRSAAAEGEDAVFAVRTDGPAGALEDYEISYTFGVDPLQQYLVRFPGGRMQPLPIAWDARPQAEGGQRWFHLYPDEHIPAGDELHWTGVTQRWNSMCAECHSTRLRRGWDAASRTYDTTWAEIDVACEACHGPGSGHVAWARGGQDASSTERGLAVRFPERGRWVFEAGSPIARRDPPLPAASREARTEVEVCARCHSRRGLIAEADPGAPLLDTHRPALLEAHLYHADGQIQGEVYVYGSFLQSRMFAAGVQCTDCHDPHTASITGDPDATCARCHSPDFFAQPTHHHHEEGGPGASCVACHMPSRLYMVVDPRRDHGFRVPRPDSSDAIGVPNACTDCHSDRPRGWAAEAVQRWRGGPAPAHFAEALHAGRERAPGAEALLVAVAADPGQPAIVRATAIDLLGRRIGAAPADLLQAALGDADPLLRMAALRTAALLEPGLRLALARPLLVDRNLAVRIGAARTLLPVPVEVWRGSSRVALGHAIGELRASLELNADRPEGLMELGVLDAELGDLGEARRAYERALEVAPWFVPAYVNLADVHRRRGSDEEGERVLRRALDVAPADANVHHALGLLLVRRGEGEKAVAALARAAELAPDSPRDAFVYALALSSNGEAETGIRVLESAHDRFPEDREILHALATLHRDQGARQSALRYAERLERLEPGDPRIAALIAELQGEGPPNPSSTLTPR